MVDINGNPICIGDRVAAIAYYDYEMCELGVGTITQINRHGADIEFDRADWNDGITNVHISGTWILKITK